MRLSMPNRLRSADERAPAAAARRFRPRIVPTLAAVAAVTACVAAGNWQQGRMHAKEALRAQFDAATMAPPVALASLPAAADWPSLRYRPVTATGEYLAERQIFIDNKVAAGRAGFHVVTPLSLGDGRIVLVNRGWIAQTASRAALPDAPPPPGTVTVQGRIAIPATGYFELQPDATSGSIRQNLDPARFAATTGLAVLPAIVEATAAPVPDDGLVRDWPAPDFGIETHRIYMVQWYAFALLATALWLWFHRPRAAAVTTWPMPRRRRSRAGRPRARAPYARTLLLIAAVTIAPVVASYAVYYLFPRAPAANYGTLLPTAPIAGIEGTRPDGSKFRLEDLRGRWVLVAQGRGDCDAACERKLYATRQARTMQGKEQDRVVRAWFVLGDAEPPAALLAQHPGLVVVRVADEVAARFPGGADPLYLIDPLGNLVLRYPDDPDIKGIAE